MSGAEDFIGAIKRQVEGPQPLVIGVGQVRMLGARLPRREQTAEIAGVGDSPDGKPVRVTRESWCRAFRLAVDAGQADGRMALVVFNARQPIVVDVMGV